MDEKSNGLYDKYLVVKKVDGTTVTGCFILRPENDPAAVIALQAYADATKNKRLADDLYKWVGRPMQKPISYERIQNSEVVWLEDKGVADCIAALACGLVGRDFMFQGRRTRVIPSKYEYGVHWRAWAARPTFEERSAAPWKESYDEQQSYPFC